MLQSSHLSSSLPPTPVEYVEGLSVMIVAGFFVECYHISHVANIFVNIHRERGFNATSPE